MLDGYIPFSVPPSPSGFLFGHSQTWWLGDVVAGGQSSVGVDALAPVSAFGDSAVSVTSSITVEGDDKSTPTSVNLRVSLSLSSIYHRNKNEDKTIYLKNMIQQAKFWNIGSSQFDDSR